MDDQTYPPKKNWRKTLLVVLVLAVGMTIISLLLGRSGDLEAGLIGGVLVGSIAAIAMLPELIIRWLRRGKTTNED
jgi:hypothetical protein